MTFAAGTSVAVEKTRAELDRLLSKHGAQQRIMGTDDVAGVAFAAFTLDRRQIRVRAPLPKREQVAAAAQLTRGWYIKGDAKQAEWIAKELEQRQRSRWRALLLLTKAKLEAVELGISTIDREFLADIALPDGRNVHQALAADLEKAYLTGTMPPLLGAGA